MQHLKCFVTIAVLGMLTLCFRHWPDLSREDDRGPLQALTQLPLLSIKRVVGAWSALLSLCGGPSCDSQVLVAATFTTDSVAQAGCCWLHWSSQRASSFSGS